MNGTASNYVLLFVYFLGRFICLRLSFFFPLKNEINRNENAGRIIPVIAHEMYLAHNRCIIFKINSPFAQRQICIQLEKSQHLEINMLIVMWFCDLTSTAAINALHKHEKNSNNKMYSIRPSFITRN